MVVTVRFTGSLRAAAKSSKLTLRVKETLPLREALNRLVKEHSALREMLPDPKLDSLGTNMLILVNGREISVLNGLQTLLNDGDEVVLVPVVHGG